MVESASGATSTAGGGARLRVVRSSNEAVPSGASPNEIIVPTFDVAFTRMIGGALSAEVMMTRAPQSLTTYSISGGVSIVFTGMTTAPMRAMAKYLTTHSHEFEA